MVVNLLYWKFDNYHSGNVSKNVFIFEACNVGMIWCTNFPQEYWVSNYTLGKLVQINNAYSIKIGLPPRDVVFGDSAFKLNGCGKFVHLPYGQIGYVDRIPVPRMNNYTYLPQEPPLFLLIDLSLISGEQDNGMFAIIIAVVLIGPNVSKFKKNCPRRNSRPNQH